MARPRNLQEHQERLSAAAWAVLAEQGLGGLTMRAVAERAGCSTGLVMHTFADKRSLLRHARELLHERTGARFDRAERATGGKPTDERAEGAKTTDERAEGGKAAGGRATAERGRGAGGAGGDGPARATLRAVLLEAASVTDGSRDEARVWIAFSAAALADPELAEVHRGHNREFVRRVARLVGRARPDWTRGQRRQRALALVCLVEGLNLLAALDPHVYPTTAQIRAIDDALQDL